jgi:RimJ/RimL family protein N-acetyltransferase
LLEGKKVNLRISEKEDIPLLQEWLSDVRFIGNYMSFPVQASKNQLESQVLEHKLYGNEWVDFIVEKKDGTKIGEVVHFIGAPNFGWVEIGYAIVPEERNKGYCTEAAQILTDYLFLTKDIGRIQATIDEENQGSKHVLEQSGFRKEGTLRKALWNGAGRWVDGSIYGILREEWKEPKILTKSH